MDIIPDLQLAYYNEDFINSEHGRIIRFLSEYLEPLSRFRKEQVNDSIVFFGSARSMSQEDSEQLLKTAEEDWRKDSSLENEKKLKIAKGVLKLAPYYEKARELSFRLTEWSNELRSEQKRFMVMTGGGGGMMEAANRGANEAGGETIGLNIRLPFEQDPNPYISQNLSFEFHYFFMRKFWFVYLAKAIAIFPGGFGTFDEFMECLTLVQTHKIEKPIPFVLFGKEFWNDVIKLERLVEWSVISEEDMDLFLLTDSVEEAFSYIRDNLVRYH